MYLLFVSYSHGEHLNTVYGNLDSLNQAIGDLIAELGVNDKFEPVKEEHLKSGENIFTQFEDGTWITITRVGYESRTIYSIVKSCFDEANVVASFEDIEDARKYIKELADKYNVFILSDDVDSVIFKDDTLYKIESNILSACKEAV